MIKSVHVCRFNLNWCSLPVQKSGYYTCEMSFVVVCKKCTVPTFYSSDLADFVPFELSQAEFYQADSSTYLHLYCKDISIVFIFLFDSLQEKSIIPKRLNSLNIHIKCVPKSQRQKHFYSLESRVCLARGSGSGMCLSSLKARRVPSVGV